MQLNTSLFKIAVLALLGGLIQASPIRCPDAIRDAILRGDIGPEACCSYGVCVGEVVAKMSEWEKDDSSALKWNNGRWGYR